MRPELAVDNTRRQTITAASIDGGGDGPHDSSMSERLSAVERQLAGIDGKLTGIAQSQTVITGGFGLLVAVTALMFGGMLYLAQKIDSLPSQVSTEIREANRAFSDAINTSLNVLRQPSTLPPALPAAPTPRVIICPPIDDPNPFTKYARPPECPPIPDKK